MRVVIVIPTYNEKENIVLLLEALFRVFAEMPHDMNILVADGNSPDGTAEAVRDAMRRHPGVDLIAGEKKGLGAAYIGGMRHALTALGADVVMEMDADFSHAPEDVPRLLREIEGGADFVIGSRYVSGGAIPAGWSFFRRMNSRWGNVLARRIAGIGRVRDCTAGFRAIRAELLRRIDLSDLKVSGYAFQVALLHKAILERARIVEVPVVFTDRVRGETKLGPSDIVEFVRNVAWIRFDSSRILLRFLAVGASGVAVNLAAFTALLRLGMDRRLASPVAIELSILTNFLLNRRWTFAHRASGGSTRVKGLKFNAVSFVSLGVSYSVFLLLSALFPAWPPQLPQLAGIVPATLLNYFLNAYWTFRETAGEGERSGW
jgi:dolichol-phosphate mannosyltransferase